MPFRDSFITYYDDDDDNTRNSCGAPHTRQNVASISPIHDDMMTMTSRVMCASGWCVCVWCGATGVLTGKKRPRWNGTKRSSGWSTTWTSSTWWPWTTLTWVPWRTRVSTFSTRRSCWPSPVRTLERFPALSFLFLPSISLFRSLCVFSIFPPFFPHSNTCHKYPFFFISFIIYFSFWFDRLCRFGAGGVGIE